MADPFDPLSEDPRAVHLAEETRLLAERFQELGVSQPGLGIAKRMLAGALRTAIGGLPYDGAPCGSRPAADTADACGDAG